MYVQVELAGERHRAEDHVSRLEAEVETLKERLQERTESQVCGVIGGEGRGVEGRTMCVMEHIPVMLRWSRRMVC